MEKRKKGGPQPGSGRPKQPDTSSHSVRLRDDIWELRDAIAGKTGETKRAVMERAIVELGEREL